MASLYSLTCSVIFLLAFLFLVPSDAAQTEFNIFVKTGNIENSGTDADVGIRLYDSYGASYEIKNLKSWGGEMGQGHNYFENGNLDSFRGTGTLISGRVCKIKLFHDNSGKKPGWYVDYVAVGTDAGFMRFDIYHWIARDEPPYQLFLVQDKCGPAAAAVSSTTAF